MSTLIKTFEWTLTVVYDAKGGRRPVPELSTPSLDEQVNSWVKETGSRIHSVSPVSLSWANTELGEPLKSNLGVEKAMTYVRSLAVLYEPAETATKPPELEKQGHDRQQHETSEADGQAGSAARLAQQAKALNALIQNPVVQRHQSAPAPDGSPPWAGTAR